MKNSLTFRIIFISLLILPLPCFVHFHVLVKDINNDIIKESNFELKSNLHNRCNAINEAINTKINLLGQVRNVISILLDENKISMDQINDRLKELIYGNHKDKIYLLTQKENAAISTLACNTADPLNIAMYENIIQQSFNGKEVTEVIFPEGNNTPLLSDIIVALPVILNKDTLLTGVLFCLTEKSNILEKALEKSYIFEDIDFAIINQNNYVVLSTDNSLINVNISTNKQEPLLEKQAYLEKNSLGVSLLNTKKGPYFSYSTKIPLLNLSIMSFSVKKELLDEAFSYFKHVYIWYAIAIIIGISLTLCFAFWISRPLNKLVSLMTEVASGNLFCRYKDFKHGFEINTLGNSLNKALDVLLANIHRIENENIQKNIYNKELEITKHIQEELFPKEMISTSRIDMAVLEQSYFEQSGHFYIFSNKTDDDFFGLVNMPGTGLSACLYAIAAKSLIRGYIKLLDDPSSIIKNVNDSFLSIFGNSGNPIKIFIGKINNHKEMFYSSCGVSGFIVHNNNELEELIKQSVVIGIQSIDQLCSIKTNIENENIVCIHSKEIIEISRCEITNNAIYKELIKYKNQPIEATLKHLQQENQSGQSLYLTIIKVK